MRRVLSLPEHLASRSLSEGDCLVWKGGTDDKGYGLICVDGKPRRVHVVAYELRHGPVTRGQVVRHSCDNPPCWRDEHLLAGTHSDNIDDMIARGRHPRIKARAQPKIPSRRRPAKRLVTQAYSLSEEQIDALRLLGEQDGRRGASEALRAVLDRDPEVRALMDTERERQSSDRIAS